MSLWGKIDQANNAPKYSIIDNSPNTGIQLYGTKVVGLDPGEVASGNATHPGWVRVKRGTGGVTSITVTAGGTGYSNTNVVQVSNGTVNAVANVVTNGSGVIQSVALSANGAGFINTAAISVAVLVAPGGAASAGSGATFTVTLGGRSGRINTETLIAMGSMTSNGSTIVGF